MESNGIEVRRLVYGGAPGVRGYAAPAGMRLSASEGESRTVEGYALLFNVKSTGLWFDETIAPGAVDTEVLGRSDVKALLNHDIRRGVLARWRGKAGSLELEVDTRGLLYRFEAAETALGDELLSGLRRGDIAESSFAFRAKEDKWTLVGEDAYGDPIYERTILKFDEIFDVSPVYDAAYEATTVYVRGADKGITSVEELRRCLTPEGAVPSRRDKETEVRGAALEAMRKRYERKAYKF